MLGVGLLGPVTAWCDDGTIRLTRPLERALLARLAIAKGNAVDVSRLLDDLWIAPENGGVAALHTLIYRLRRTLGSQGAKLVRSGGGYALEIDGQSVDVSRFDRMAARGRSYIQAGELSQAAETFAAALALWRGPALADVGDVPFAPAQQAILQESRLEVFEQRVQALMHSGLHGEVVAELETAVVEEPLRESLWEKLILALYRCGRQSDSLTAYRRVRLLLAEELGVDPSPSLAALHQAVLEQNPELTSIGASSIGEVRRPTIRHRPSKSTAVLPVPSAIEVESARPFVGRAAELARLERLVGTRDSRLATLWILGEPGVGKTRLAVEVARRAHAGGAVVLFGRCNEDVAAPYQPFLEALQWYIARVPAAELVDRLGDSPSELCRLAPGIPVRLPDIALPTSAGPELEQHRFFEAVRTWLAAAGAGRPVVVLLDDLQWASRPTLALVGHVARSAEPSPVTLVCTARNTLPDDNQALTGLIDELTRRKVPGERLELTGLSVEAVAELVQVGGQQPMDDWIWERVGRLHADTAGNPLLLDVLMSTPTDPTVNAAGNVSSTLAATVASRLARQPAGVGELLHVAAVAGVEFDLRVIAHAAGLPEPDALSTLETAEAAALLEEAAVNRYRFRHALVRDVLKQQLSRSRRARLHFRVAESIEVVYSDSLEDHAGALAFHFCEAQAPGGAAKAFRYMLMHAQRATRMLSHPEAADSYDRALVLLDAADGTGPSRSEVLLLLGEAQRKAGKLLEALGTFRSAAEEAATKGGFEQLAAAAVEFEDTSFWLGYSGQEASELLDRAVKVLPAVNPALRALTVASYARALDTGGRTSEAARRAQEALALAKKVEDPGSRLAVAFRTTPSSLRVEHAQMSADRWRALYEAAEEIGDTDTYLFALAEAMWAVAMLGDLATWDDLLARYSSIAAQLQQPRWESWLHCFLAFRSFLAADLEQAELYLDRSQRVSEGFGAPGEGLYGVAMYLIRREQGRLAELMPPVQAAVQLNAGAMWRPGLGALYAELGRLDDARALFERAISDALHGIPTDGTWDLTVGLLAEVCVAVRDDRRAPLLIEMLRPSEGRLLAFLGCAASLGPVDRLLGSLASVAGRASDADVWHRRSVEFARRLGSPLWLARCLMDAASHILRCDELAARRMVSEAAAISNRHNLISIQKGVAGFGH